MDKQINLQDLLQHVPQPGFLVREGRILFVNQAAAALLLSVGMELQPLLQTGQEEYAQLQTGQLYLSLALGEECRSATVTRMEALDLFLLDSPEDQEEFRSMALISMELRSPLTRLMSSAAQLLEKQDLSDPETAAQAARMNRSLHQLLRLTCNLSDVSRYTTAHRELRDMDSFLLELFEKAKTLTESSGITFTFEGLRQPVFGLIDPEQMERAVWNILSNAVKFMPQGGTIQAKLTRQGNRLRLTVADSGSGIAEAVRMDLFRRYLRQPGIEDHRYGLGLGMVIIRSAAANHGGTVLIDRHGESGTRITMTFSLQQKTDTSLRSPVFRPDYTGGWDHGLLELSDCLPESLYREI